MSERDIFIGALQADDPAGRRAYLEAACGADDALRRRVDGLLEVYGRAGSFLEEPAGPPTGTAAYAPSAAGDAAPGPEAGVVIAGRYKLLEVIGEGGMGTVWLAEQTEPVRRKVALKVVKAGMDSRQVLARFEAERQALALMDHPNIAKVLDGGATADGRPFFVMELVKGVPITKYCDDHHLTPCQRLELFVAVCQAVQHAHQKGVIHRDLKPSNVLVAPYDGRPVVKVIDFGVAKAAGQPLTEKTLFTGLGAVVGTPEYMSPEQAELNNADVDTRSDVFSLGVLLYELLTGSTPLTHQRLKAAALLEVLRLVREEEPPRPSTRLSTAEGLPSIAACRGLEPRKLSGVVRGELDWIVMKALEKDRNRRYETVNGFAADVQRYLADEPVQACPPSAGYRFRKFVRRNKAALATATAAALAVVLTVAGLAASNFLITREQRETAKALDDATAARDDLKRTNDRERRDANFHRISLAQQGLSTDNLGRALKLLEECPEDLREWEWHYLMRLCRVEPLVLRDKTEVNGVAFSPDGERLTSAGGDGVIKIWNSRTGKVVQTFEAHKGSVASVAFNSDGKHVASAGPDGYVKVWDLTTGKAVFTGPCDVPRKFGTAYTVAFSRPDGRQVAAGSDGAVRVWDWKNSQLLHTFGGHEIHSVPVAFSRDGRRLATSASREGQKVWDTEKGGPPLRTFPAHRHPVSALAFSPDGGRLASASFDRSVKVWDTTTGGLLDSLLHTGHVDCVAFSPDGQRLASGGEDKTVRIWHATTGREVLGLRGHTGRCGSVAFSPDGRRLASASHDGTIRVWDATPLCGDEGQEILTFTRHTADIYTVAVSPDGQRVASAGHDPLVKVWDAQSGRVSIEFPGHQQVIFCVAWRPDGQRIASAGSEGPLHSVKVWDARNGREAFAVSAGREGSAVPYSAVAFSPDGRYLVTGQLNGAVQVWDAGTGQWVGTLGTHGREIGGVIFSRDGRQLASASTDGVVKLWDATRLDNKQEARGSLRARVPGLGLNVAFSRDGRRLATGGEDNTVKIWDVEKGTEVQTLQGHSGEVYTVAFSPDDDGRWLASAGEDSAVKVWDSHTGKLVRSFRGHTGLVSSVAFSPDGRRLVSGSRDRTAKVWDVSQLKEVPDR